MPEEPFDRSLPSPLRILADLRYRATEAVVREEAPTDVQRRMAQPGRLEERLWEVLGDDGAPKLMVLTGSAGSGKSATINHLISHDQDEGGGLIGERLVDATHSDAPDQEQGERLARFFAPFADDAAPPAGPCRLVALNTGMALSFFHELPQVRDAPRLTGLETLLRQRLGLPTRPADPPPPSWLEQAVLVINLDLRPTSGTEGDLFEEILGKLDPDREEGVLGGAARCGTCQVRDWCWPMANATAISAPTGRAAVNSTAGSVALVRGRQLAPRALWDAAAELVLSGLRCDAEDPCDEIAAVAAASDIPRLLHGLACSAALDTPNHGSLLAAMSGFDPSFAASEAAHGFIAHAGLEPDKDTDRLAANLGDHPAVTRAAAFLRAGTIPADGSRNWGRMLARAAWLGGELTAQEAIDPAFAAALTAQAAGLGIDDDAILAALELIQEGLAQVFGVVAGSEHFYPTASNSAGASADLLVKADLLDGHLHPATDAWQSVNPRGAQTVGYRPLALSIQVAERPVSVDYPLWQLLRSATEGAPPSIVEIERFLSLRTAMRQVGVDAAAAGADLLVRQRGPEGRKFKLASRSATSDALRATEMV